MDILKIMNASIKWIFSVALINCIPLYLENFKLVYICILAFLILIGTILLIIYLFLSNNALKKELNSVVLNRNGLIQEKNKLKKQLNESQAISEQMLKKLHLTANFLSSKQLKEVNEKINFFNFGDDKYGKK